MTIKSDFVGYANYRITAIDGIFSIRYKWPLLWFKHEKTIHAIASVSSQGEVRWRVAPESEPIIADAKGADGFKVVAKANGKDFGIVMKSLGVAPPTQ